MTGQREGSLSRAVLSGAGWLSASRFTVQAIQLIIGLFLARLLTPADFGLVASATALVGIAVLVVEGGLTSALIHHTGPTERDLSTVFWINVLGGIGLALTTWLFADQIASFFGQPALTSIAPVVGLSFAAATAVVHKALLFRQLKFMAGAAIDTVATICGLAVTLILAFAGFGAMSLAIGPVVSQVLGSLAYPFAIRWRPTSFLSVTSLRGLLGYSLPLLGATLTDYLTKNTDTVLIGKYVGPAALGYYNRAYNLMLLPVTQVVGAVGSAVSPALARIESDKARAANAYERALRSLGVVMAPIIVGLAAVADGLVPLLWGSQWLPSVPLLQVLCIAGLAQCIGSTTTWLYQAQRRTKTMLRVTILWTVAAVGAMVAGLQWGALGVAIALLLRYWLGLPFELWVATRTLELNFARLLGRVLVAVVPAAAMGAVVWTAPLLLNLSRTSILCLGIQVLLGAVIVAGLTFALLRDTLSVARGVLSRKAPRRTPGGGEPNGAEGPAGL